MSRDRVLRDRPTVRVLLFDPDGRILLMRGRLPSRPDGPGYWFAVGGGLEPGETLEQAAVRELVEETGFMDVTLGPVVWEREGPLKLADGETVMFRERYLIGRCAGGEPCRDGWDEQERALMDDLCWWTADALAACGETIFPRELPALLPDLLAGRYPAEPMRLTWS
ncbi:MAG: NUDIX domain-containing protein [Proteobacteria bacterium]|nr:NUDIX domain-containing protein [Pseudomonadota bacterium]